MTDKLTGKVVAITGSGRGIGRAVALRMAQEGARIVVGDYGGPVDGIGASSSAPAEAVVREISEGGGEAVAVIENVATISGGEKVTNAALEHFGRLDGLVCCAGIMGPQKPMWELTEEEWDAVITVHIRGHFASARAAVPVMMRQGTGRLIFFSSSASVGSRAPGVTGDGGSGPYGVAKAGILGLLWGTAPSLQEHGITVNAMFPGAATRMIDRGLPQGGAGSRLHSDLAGGTWRDPTNVAPVIIYLVSDAGAKTTGQIFGAIGSRIVHFDPVRARKLIIKNGFWEVDELFEVFPKEFGEELAYDPGQWPPKIDPTVY